MTEAEHKAVVRRFYEQCMNQGDASAVEEVISAGFVDRSYGLRGVTDVQQFVRRGRTTWPEIRFTIEDVVAEADRVAVRWTARGTHHTGTQATWTGMGFYRLADGKIVEHWANSDQLGLQQQLSATSPARGSPPSGQHS
jgi:predicted ester cyclase